MKDVRNFLTEKKCFPSQFQIDWHFEGNIQHELIQVAVQDVDDATTSSAQHHKFDELENSVICNSGKITIRNQPNRAISLGRGRT